MKNEGLGEWGIMRMKEEPYSDLANPPCHVYDWANA